MKTDIKMFNIRDILKIIPHSYPFLLIDRIVECIPGKSATSIKNVTFNEPYFPGHFPNNPVMPGVLIIEAMAQTCAVCKLTQLQEENDIKNPLVYFTMIEKAKFRKPVTPGDQLKIMITLVNTKNSMCKFECEAYVDNNKVAESTITAALSETNN